MPSATHMIGPDPAALTCTLIEDFLSQKECTALIERLEAAGIGATAALYPPSYRNNDRLVLDDEALAEALYPRITAHAPELLFDGETHETAWRRERLNPRFRCCRYRNGQGFTIHRDGEYHAAPDARSRLTFMIYLNDASEFTGGATRYYRDRSGQDLIRTVAPRRGACIIFDHALWHDGEPVPTGTKYVLRSDVIYRQERVGAKLADPARHLGYIWTATLLSNNSLASAGRDQTIRIFSINDTPFDLHELQILQGHQSSIGCLVESNATLFSGDRSGHIRSWRSDGNRFHPDTIFSAHEGAVLSLLHIHHPTHGECIASSGADGVIRFFSNSLIPISELRGQKGWIWCLTSANDHLYSGGEDGTVRRFDLQSSACLATRSFEIPIHSLLCTSDSLLAGLSDGRVIALDPQTFAPRSEHRLHRGSVRCLIALSDGRIASGSEDDTVALWTRDLQTNLHRAAHNDFVRALVELPSGAILSASYDGTLRCFDPRSICAPPESQTSHSPTRRDLLQP